jgi:hypothetical protein
MAPFQGSRDSKGNVRESLVLRAQRFGESQATREGRLCAHPVVRSQTDTLSDAAVDRRQHKGKTCEAAPQKDKGASGGQEFAAHAVLVAEYVEALPVRTHSGTRAHRLSSSTADWSRK